MGVGAPELILIGIVSFFFWLLPIILGYSMGKTRSIGGAGGLLLGFFLSYLGVIIVALSSKVQQPVFYNFDSSKPAASTADELKNTKTC